MSAPTPTRPDYTTAEESVIIRNRDGVPVGTRPHTRWTWQKVVLWVVIAVLGAVGWTMLAIVRGERVNTIWFVVAAVCTYAIGYRFYALFIQKAIMRPDDSNATPGERINNGKDFDPTNRVVLYGHHFAAIAGAGPLVGPVLAAQMGYLPGTLWIILGVVVAGAVQDMLVLSFSMRRGGRSLGQMATDEIGRIGGAIATVIVFVMLMIVLAVLALVCVNALADSPWGVFSVACTIVLAIAMGLWLRYVQPGRITSVSIAGFVLLIVAIISGRWVSTSPLAGFFHLSPTALVVWMVIYGFFAAVLPVWVLLTPRDYLSTFMKVGTIVVLAVGIIVVRPIVQMPAVTEFASNTAGPAFAGTLFPFLFITIACGALSGMHAMVSSGTTPKMIQKESQVRMIGYGGMLMESFVAIMALAAAVSLNQGIYFAMNTSAATINTLAGPQVVATQGTSKEDVAAAAVHNLKVTDAKGNPIEARWDSTDENGTPVTLTGGDALRQVAKDVGEPSIVSRTGGAPTLAVGIANITHRFAGGRTMMGFWYHFAIMFEALFILSAVDAVTRVARFQLSDAIGNLVPRFRDPSWRPGAWLSTAVVVAAWGSLLLMGVTDPRGGIQTLYPLFGIANQLIAAVALIVVTVMVVRKGFVRYVWIPLVPLAFDVATTFTASWQKIFSSDPAIGYWKQWSVARVAYDKATAAGKADVAQVQHEVIRNTFIQGTLSIIFLAAVAAVLVFAAVRVFTTLRTHDTSTSEDPHQESNFYAPSGLVATALEKKLVAEYAVVGDPDLIPGRRHGEH
ncbi:carbon starvation CstA family protein [Raineyella sp. LH-20]|uniref:carbon starvation CstA family protein n=1 Tax=Raineyella sp. LH-20 TaxID=3081204 RepID=UPI00295483EB|nr:carbon starvation CstA family protein [Raineyella sp. LH-20]WOP17853.1 carbon starvation CstA family protein [Raineyella sp. LH-20]